MTKKKTDETMISSEAVENNTEMEEIIDVSEEKTVSADENTAPLEEPVTPKKKRATKKKTETEAAEVSEVSEAEMEEEPAPKRKRVPKEAPILTIDVDGDVETEEQLAEIAWHEIRNAYRTRRILTGMLGGIEQTDNGKTVAIVEYKGYRIIIPLREMVVNFPNNVSGDDYKDLVVRQYAWC